MESYARQRAAYKSPLVGSILAELSLASRWAFMEKMGNERGEEELELSEQEDERSRHLTTWTQSDTSLGS